MKGDITTNINKIHRIMREHFGNLCSNKLENLEEMDKFVDLPKLKQEDANHLNRTVRSNEVKVVIKSLPTKKSPGPDGFTARFYQTIFFKKELTSISSNYSRKQTGKEHYQTHSIKIVLHLFQNRTRTQQ
jgi:hypothetical protein